MDSFLIESLLSFTLALLVIYEDEKASHAVKRVYTTTITEQNPTRTLFVAVFQ